MMQLSGRYVELWTRSGIARAVIGVDLPKPYAFTYPEHVGKVEEQGCVCEETDLLHHITKRQVVKYSCDTPSHVARVREIVGYDNTFEADIPYTRRLFIDRDVEVDYGDKGAMFIDIEVDDSEGFPKPETSPIISIAYAYLDDRKPRWMYIWDYGGERQMLNEFRRIIHSYGTSVVIGWNVKFDAEYLNKRAGLELETIDLMELYKGEVKGLESYSLSNVARHEGMGSKSRSKPVSQMSRQELEDYNVNDLNLLMAIEEKYGLARLQLRIAEIVNLPVSMLTPVRIGDTLILRRARELGYVLSNGVREKKRNYPGAYVFEPRRKGLVRNVAVFDFESLYPNIIINERVDIPGFNGEVLPYIESELIRLRKEAKNKLKETGDVKYDIEQKAYKILANSLYGLFGTEGFRFMDINKASFITGKGREMLMKASGLVEELGYEVIYGDTDSIFVAGWGIPEELPLIEEYLNRFLSPYRMKLEYYGDAYMITKKKYIFRASDGKRIYKGVEVVRGDWAKLFKEVMSNIVDMVFEGKDTATIRAYLASVKEKLYRGELNDKLVMCKAYTSGKKYKVEAEHVRAVKKLVAKGIPEHTIVEVCYVYVPYGDGVEPVLDANSMPRRLDYNRYWQRLMQLVSRVVVLSHRLVKK